MINQIKWEQLQKNIDLKENNGIDYNKKIKREPL